ncbi:MAG: electron transport protein [Bacillaceae bacterium]|nr:electron transport protein [Bacillaceae bacterium]
MKQNQKKRLLLWLGIIGTVIVVFLWTEPEYTYLPPEEDITNPSVQIAGEENRELGRQLKLGKETFYQETFGNEVFFTDILGLFDGPIKTSTLFQEIYQLRGKGTDNLQITLPETVNIGGKTFEKGTVINTGLDVPRNAYVPLGLSFKYQDGRIKTGMSCALCHATVNREGQVIQGAPNKDLNAGLLLAMAKNSAAYFSYTDVVPMQDYLKGKRKFKDSKEQERTLPDPHKFENAVDRSLLNTAPGNFDLTSDFVHNPTQIPDLFTRGDHPYGWDGFAAYGDYKGLSSATNQMHIMISDPISRANGISEAFGIDKELFLGTILQNAASDKLRLRGVTPSEFWEKNKPNTNSPGVLKAVKNPGWPKGSEVAPDALTVGTKKFKFGEQINAMARWQNTLMPPPYQSEVRDEEKRRTLLEQGEKIFQQAGCITCHAGPSFSSNRIIPSEKIGTEDSRARALSKMKKNFTESKMYEKGTRIPIPKDAKSKKMPLTGTDPDSYSLVYDASKKGGYKTKGLIGLHLTPPYLHDGGVAVGAKPGQWGLTDTLLKGRPADPANSLKALIDREWREQVIRSNFRSARLLNTHTTGEGHAYWVDEQNGYSPDEQRALIEYLLTQTTVKPK